MADKRTDKDDNVKEDRSWQFIQEKIVRQPLSRRQIVRYIILTAVWNHISGLFYSDQNCG